MANLIDGKRISQEIKEELKMKVAQLKEQGIEGCLAVIQVSRSISSRISASVFPVLAMYASAIAAFICLKISAFFSMSW